MSQTDNKKDVIIVGTGIAGSLIAKLLTDHVFDTKKENDSQSRCPKR